MYPLGFLMDSFFMFGPSGAVVVWCCGFYDVKPLRGFGWSNWVFIFSLRKVLLYPDAVWFFYGVRPLRGRGCLVLWFL